MIKKKHRTIVLFDLYLTLNAFFFFIYSNIALKSFTAVMIHCNKGELWEHFQVS